MEQPKPVSKKIQPKFTNLERGSSAAVIHGYVWGESPMTQGEKSLHNLTAEEMYSHEEPSQKTKAQLSGFTAMSTVIGKMGAYGTAGFLATGNPLIGIMTSLAASFTPGPAESSQLAERIHRNRNEYVDPLEINFEELGEQYTTEESLNLSWDFSEIRNYGNLADNFGYGVQFNEHGIFSDDIQDAEDIIDLLEGAELESQEVVVLEERREDNGDPYSVGDILAPKKGQDQQEEEGWLRISYASATLNTPLGQKKAYDRPNLENLGENGVLEAVE